MRTRQAATLIETMVVSAVLGLFLTMVGRALVMGMQAHTSTSRKTTAYRNATIAIARLVREISTCNRWDNPPTGSGPFTPTVQSKVVFRRNAQPAPGQAVGSTPVQYWLDVPSRELRTADTLRPSGYRVVARDVTRFQLDVQEPTVIVRTEIYGLDAPIVVTCHAPQM